MTQLSGPAQFPHFLVQSRFLLLVHFLLPFPLQFPLQLPLQFQFLPAQNTRVAFKFTFSDTSKVGQFILTGFSGNNQNRHVLIHMAAPCHTLYSIGVAKSGGNRQSRIDTRSQKP
jgi:hypothetical protein